MYRQERNHRGNGGGQMRYAGIRSQKYPPGQNRIPKGGSRADLEGRRRRYQRRKRQQRRRAFFLTAVIVFFLAGGRILYVFLQNQLLSAGPVVTEGMDGDDQESGSLDQPSGGFFAAEDGEEGKQKENIPDIQVDLAHLHSHYAVLMDFESGAFLSGYNAQTRIYPASLTKIMTAVLAVENTEDMEEVVTVPEDFFPGLYAEDASMAGFLPGESARLRDLLYGILLPSGAECCMTFAYRIAGTEEAFVGMMNQKAEELGLEDTHFCNATGLHDPDHYSTAEDLAVLLRYALQSETFREAFTGSRYSTLPSKEHPDGFTFVSTMFRYMDSAEVTGGRILGGKTGYTEEAGQCLASLAEVNGREYILVTAQAPGSHTTEQFHILDAVDVYSRIGEQGAGNIG